MVADALSWYIVDRRAKRLNTNLSYLIANKVVDNSFLKATIRIRKQKDGYMQINKARPAKVKTKNPETWIVQGVKNIWNTKM